MNWLKNRSLKQLSLLTAALAFILIVLEGWWLMQRFTAIQAIEYQIDFAQKLQLQFQRIAQLAESASGETEVMAQIKSQNYQLDKLLVLLHNGGKVPGSTLVLEPLPDTLQKTYAGLVQSWEQFKNEQQEHFLSRNDSTYTPANFYASSISVAEQSDAIIADFHFELDRQESALTRSTFLILLLDLCLIGGIILGFNEYILKPLKAIETNTVDHQHTNGLPRNEIGRVAFQINSVIEQLRDATDFVKSIGEGNLTKNYQELEPDYQPGKNQLADSLIAMQSKLHSLNEEEQKRQWANEGLARFVDILRSTNNNLQVLGDRIISALVKYTKSNQGGLYVLNEDDPQNKHLELVSLFAFDIKKYQKQKVKLGEGILGQTFLEKETTYMTVIPDEYIRITSGLGDANPRALLIVPLKVEDQVYGVVELASFNEFQPHEINFVEKLGETIASTLASVKAAQQNQKLLDESRLTTEAMRSQEEEMRQNMEELTATQEEMQRVMKEAQQKETYLSNLMNASTDAFVAIDRDYKVVLRNNAPLFEEFVRSGIPYEVGFYVLGLFKADEFEYHKSIYDQVFAGQSLQVTKEYFGRQYSVNYKPLRSPTGEVIGAALYAHDLTERLALENQLAELKRLAGQGGDIHTTDLEKTLKINLEALKITQEELRRKLS